MYMKDFTFIFFQRNLIQLAKRKIHNYTTNPVYLKQTQIHVNRYWCDKKCMASRDEAEGYIIINPRFALGHSSRGSKPLNLLAPQ